MLNNDMKKSDESYYKKLIQLTVRDFHKVIFFRQLNDKIAIYFHDLLKDNYKIFEELVVYFKDHGYNFCDPLSFIKSENKSVFISFDDNYYSWYPLVDLLAKLNIKATFYCNTLPIRDLSNKNDIDKYFDNIKYFGERKTLSTDEVRAIHRTGNIIGCHTHSHAMLTSISPDDAKKEIEEGKRILEKIVGGKIVHFSYPFGMRRHFSENLRMFCKNIGLQTIASAIPCLQYKNTDLLDIHRNLWVFKKSAKENIENLRIDGSFFEKITGRSAVG